MIQDLIASNPAAGLSLTLPKVQRRELAPWESHEFAKFLDSVDRHRLGPLFEMAAFTGLRRGEVLGPRWEDVDLLAGVGTVGRQLVSSGEFLTDQPPKTGDCPEIG